jgi:uncharacterized membrane protein
MMLLLFFKVDLEKSKQVLKNKYKMDNQESGKTAAITSYILLVGIPIALSMNSENKSEFAAFHIRQALGIALTFISLGMIISPFDNFMITIPMWIFVSILWTYGMFSAINGSTKPMPILGNFFQKYLKNIG